MVPDARRTVDLPDHAARRAALTDFGHNLVVTAGAGTGKTSLLVGRLLAALLTQHIDPDCVLAVTFTENAAAEMRERLVRMLSAVPAFVAGESVDAADAFVLAALGIGPEHVRRAGDVLGDVDRLVLSTFHGFCLRLLQEHAAALDLPAVVQVGSDESVRARFDRDFFEFLGPATEGEHAEALERFDAAELRELAFALLNMPEEAWDELRRPFQPHDLPAREADLRALVDAHAGARPAWRDCADAVLSAYAALRRGEAAAGRPDVLAKNTPKAGKRELGEQRDAAATEGLDAHRKYVLGLLDADEESIALAHAFLLPFLHAQRQARARAGELSFDDLLLLVRRVLLDRGAVRKKLAQRFQTILVDEFQDTDPLQYDVLFLLASDPARDPGGAARDPCALALRPCLFIVGDAKQSVYRFRRADVGAYFRAVEHVASGRRLALSANFRSRPQILHFVNETCRHTLTEDVPYQLGYEAVVPVRGGSTPARVELLLLEADALAGKAHERRQREGRAIQRLIGELQAEGVKLGDIAILLRAAADTTWLLRPLRQADIPYVLQGSRRFYSRHEIVLAGALMAAMARPFDAVPTLAVLRSALCGASDRDLLRHRASGGTFDWRQEPAGEGAVAEGMRFLRDLHGRIAGQPLHEALPAILRHEELLLVEGSGFEGAQRLANLDRLLQQLLRAAPLDLAEAAALVERRTLRETDDEESPLFDRDTDAVRIMTVHAAKGLEFEVVIVPDLARRPPSDPDGDGAPAQRTFTADGRALVAVQVGERKNRAALVARVEAGKHQEAEERRLFYVAATRAKERLLLVGHDDEKLTQESLWQRDLTSVPVGSNGLLVRPMRPTGIEAIPTTSGPDEDLGSTVEALAAHRALAVRAAQAARRRSLRPSAVDDRPGRWPVTGGVAGEAARRRGQAAHAYLAVVDLQRTDVDPDLLAAVSGAEADRDELYGWLARFHRGDVAAALRSAAWVEREIALTYRDGDGQVVHGIVDVVFADAAGDVHVLDWKTDRDPDPEAHVAQLAAYARGVQAVLGLTRAPTTAAVFLAKGDA
ncbi:MAG: UvrD-helicase domain-containing protein [Planctomycetota bacterium]